MVLQEDFPPPPHIPMKANELTLFFLGKKRTKREVKGGDLPEITHPPFIPFDSCSPLEISDISCFMFRKGKGGKKKRLFQLI